MNLSRRKGFTLIELLVVIAIIGILSAVVLASLNTARGKGSNATVKADLHGIRSQAAIYYDNNTQNYTDMCINDQNIINAVNAAIIAGGDLVGTVATRCNSIADAWAVDAQLKVPDLDGNTWWCVDSESVAKTEPSEIAGATSCP